MTYVIQPPEQYRFDPPSVQVLTVAPAQVKALCDPFNRLPLASAGCQLVSAMPKCVVIILDTLPADIQAKVREHEVAHCNGWPADHPRR